MILQDPDTEILHKCPHNRDLVQVLLQDPDRSGPKDPHTEILKHRSCTSCPTGSWYSGPKGSDRDLAEVVLQDPDRSDPTRSWEILHKCPYNRDLVQVLLQDPDTSGPRILTQRSWNTDLAQVVQQDPDTVVQQDPDTVVQKDPDTEFLRSQGPWYKWSKRILH